MDKWTGNPCNGILFSYKKMKYRVTKRHGGYSYKYCQVLNKKVANLKRLHTRLILTICLSRKDNKNSKSCGFQWLVGREGGINRWL